jgi:hypothetical protein
VINPGNSFPKRTEIFNPFISKLNFRFTLPLIVGYLLPNGAWSSGTFKSHLTLRLWQYMPHCSRLKTRYRVPFFGCFPPKPKIHTSPGSGNTAAVQLHSSRAAQQHSSTSAQQHNSTAATAAQHYCNTAAQQHSSAAAKQFSTVSSAGQQYSSLCLLVELKLLWRS